MNGCASCAMGNTSKPIVWTIDSRYFNAGLVIGKRTQRVMKAAPIIKYMVGWDSSRVLNYCLSKGWQIHRGETSNG